MLTFKRNFVNRRQAMDVYKTQLSNQFVYVESFEAYSHGTEVSLVLSIAETAQSITLNAVVDRTIGKREVMENKYGTRPGLLLNVPITPDVVEPLRTFFIGDSVQKPATPPPVAKPSVPRVSSVTVPPRRPVVPRTSTETLPFDNIKDLSPEDALKEVNRYLGVAKKGNLYQLFNTRSDVDHEKLRNIYNTVVRKLHPDRYSSGFSEELSDKLSDAYQIINEAYSILQSPVKSAIYKEISLANRSTSGLSLEDYKKALSDYRIKNSSSVNLAEELVQKAEAALNAGNKAEAEQNLKLARQYDPYNEAARSMVIN